MEFGNQTFEPAEEQRPYKLWLLILMVIATGIGLYKLVRIFFIAFSVEQLTYAIIALGVAVVLFIFSRK